MGYVTLDILPLVDEQWKKVNIDFCVSVLG